jgi:uncharacterized protein
MRRVAIVGSGISGLAAARELAAHASVTLFEAGDTFGGHAHTVDVTLEGSTHGVDTGFLVFNERTYPNLIRLFGELQVETALSDMSFSVQSPATEGSARLEWSGSDLNAVFAQRGNLLRPGFWRMLRDLLRFNRLCTTLAEREAEGELVQPIGDFLDQHRFSREFREWYFLPMIGSIWSCPTAQMLRFPIATMIRFCHNHGLIQIANRPRWFTVRGGARRYVDRIVAGLDDARLATPVRSIRRLPPAGTPGGGNAGVFVATDAGSERFDAVVLACHSDQSLALLADPSPAETSILSAIPYRDNDVVLHTDTRLLPRRRRAWSSWNYRLRAGAGEMPVLSYDMNILQRLESRHTFCVSLNDTDAIDPTRVLGRYRYSHPVFTVEGMRAQQRWAEINGTRRTWYCGAWWGNGFHEDGVLSARRVAEALGAPW